MVRASDEVNEVLRFRGLGTGGDCMANRTGAGIRPGTPVVFFPGLAGVSGMEGRRKEGSEGMGALRTRCFPSTCWTAIQTSRTRSSRSAFRSPGVATPHAVARLRVSSGIEAAGAKRLRVAPRDGPGHRRVLPHIAGRRTRTARCIRAPGEERSLTARPRHHARQDSSWQPVPGPARARGRAPGSLGRPGVKPPELYLYLTIFPCATKAPGVIIATHCYGLPYHFRWGRSTSCPR